MYKYICILISMEKCVPKSKSLHIHIYLLFLLFLLFHNIDVKQDFFKKKKKAHSQKVLVLFHGSRSFQRFSQR